MIGYLFCRIFATEKNKDIYEVFDCPIQKITTEVYLNDQIGYKQINKKLEVIPTIPINKNNIKINVLLTTLLPTQIFEQTFITFPQKTIIFDSNKDLNLKCKNKEATQFNCTF